MTAHVKDRFRERLGAFAAEGELAAFNLACIAEAIDTIERLRNENAGKETVEQRLGEYKAWDPEIFRVDKDCEDGFRRRLEARGAKVVLLSEEAGRVEIHGGKPGDPLYAVADPFDGSYLFKRDIPGFWYTSLAFYDKDLRPLTAAVGDPLEREVAFATPEGAFLGILGGDGFSRRFRLDAAFRKAAGRGEVARLEDASIQSYAMKPKKFCLPLVDKWRKVIEPFKFFLPNGGPWGFVDVALGKIDVYFAPRQPYVDVFSGILIGERAGCIVTDFDGRPIRPGSDAKTLWDVVCSRSPALHEQVLARVRESRG